MDKIFVYDEKQRSEWKRKKVITTLRWRWSLWQSLKEKGLARIWSAFAFLASQDCEMSNVLYIIQNLKSFKEKVWMNFFLTFLIGEKHCEILYRPTNLMEKVLAWIFFWHFSSEKNISQLYCYPPALVLICLLLPFTLLNLYKLGEKSINVRCKKNHCMQLLNDVTEIV